MKFKLIPILVLSLLLIPCVANGEEYTHKFEKPLYFYDFETWNKNYLICEGEKFEYWEDMSTNWFKAFIDHKFIKINTNDNTCIIDSVANLNISNYVFSVTNLDVRVLSADGYTRQTIVLDLEIKDSSLNLYTTNLSDRISATKYGSVQEITITQLYYDVIISDITFNVLSEKTIKNSSLDQYAFNINITNDIKLVNLAEEDFTILTNLYPEENFRRVNELFEFENPSSYYITNGSPVYVNGKDVGKVTNNNQIAWNGTLLEKYDEYIQIKEISFLPISSVTNAWDRNPNKGYVRQSISNFVTNAVINPVFRTSVKEYFETNLPKVSITNKCKQPVKVQIGDEKPFDLNRLTTTNIVNSFLFDKESVQIKYWVTNSCSKCPITTNVVDQTFNKYNRDDYEITLENIPLQKDVSYVSITNIPENATVEFNGKKLSPTDGIITISTNSHTNGFFVVEQDYYAPLTNQFTSGCINFTNYIACPKLEKLTWQNCLITNTSLEHSCKVIISYSNITNDVTIARNSSLNYKLESQSIIPIDVTFSWNTTNSITQKFTRGKKNQIKIEVQGEKENPLDRFQDMLDDGSVKQRQINDFCGHVFYASESTNNRDRYNCVKEAFMEGNNGKNGIFNGYEYEFEDVTNIITQAKKTSGEPVFARLLENGSIETEYFKVIRDAFFEVIQNKKENKYEK